jgi:WD40 repeat protein
MLISTLPQNPSVPVDMTETNAIAKLNARSRASLARAIFLSQGQFSLILVRCNYLSLREQMWQALQDEIKEQSGDDFYIKTVELPKSVPTLFNPLLAHIEAEPPSRPPRALMVFGLESVQALDRAIAATNQVREEFRKHFSFPVVLWANDEVLHKLARYAPDFKSWAAAAIKFELASKDAITLWWYTTDNLFKHLLALGVDRFIENAVLDLAPGCPTRQELEYARADVYAAQESLAPLSEATWQFILGRDAMRDRDLNRALECYHKSLSFWERGTGCWPLDIERLPVRGQTWTNIAVNPFLEQKALLLFHIGLCYCRRARAAFSQNQHYWLEAKRYFGASLEIFAVKSYSDLVAQLIVQLGEVLYHLEAWHELELLALYSLQQPITTNISSYTARSYGFLAQVALGQTNWREAEFWTRRALEAQGSMRLSHGKANGEAGRERQWCRDRALYLLLLASIQTQLGATNIAIDHLEQARMRMQQAALTVQGFEDRTAVDSFRPVSDSEPLYLDILEALRSLYFQQQQYRRAFDLKQEKLALEQSCGLRAFQGASPLLNPYFYPDQPFGQIVTTQPPPEIAASGRNVDIQALLERFSRSEHKLTVVHGASGAGKSSLLCSGLVPALWGKIIAAREVVPVIQTVYNDWEQEFTQALQRAITFLQSDPACSLPPINELPPLEQLQHHCQQNRLLVLIFDQFEEFFFLCSQPEKRQEFYHFFRNCLNLPFVKIILSLREDYLHYLLLIEENVNLDAIDNNILDRQIRYRLTDMNCEAAIRTVELLAARSQFHLEPALIGRLVQDLANKNGLVRPVELQVVGAALQAEKITTIAQYEKLGPDPKTVLVERSLATLVSDCGPDNEAAAWQILYALTNERGMRPVRTRENLSFNVDLERPDNRHSLEAIDLILTILVGSGLVSRVFDEPEDRFQLVHDYLVSPIRQEYHDRLKRQIQSQLQRSQMQVTQARAQIGQVFGISAIVLLLAIASARLGWQAQWQRQLALQASRNTELLALSSSAEALLASHKSFESLVESLRAASRIQQYCPHLPKPPKNATCPIQPDVQLKVATILEQSLHNVLEHNRLESHADITWQVRFAPNNRFLATASRDRTVKLWRPNGELYTTLSGHRASVTSVDISRQGLIASSSWDGTVYLWESNGHPRLQINVGTDRVYSVRFSPDGQHLVTASADGTATIWTLEGKAQQTLSGPEGIMYWATYSPDGRLIATAGDDGSIRLWTAQGELLRRIRAHTAAVNYVTFSPDGKAIASASHDRTAKVWDLWGNRQQELTEHTSFVYSIEFSPDGKAIATASNDATIRLWDRQGQLQATLRNHSDGVTFATFSPDGRYLASSSYDKTVKLWALRSPPRIVLIGHTDFVLDIAFSRDERVIATASRDRTGKLWTRQGKAIATLNGHTGPVNRIRQSPDNQVWATASDDGTVKLWSDRGQELHTLIGHRAPVLSLAWSPDGKRLATSSEDHTVKLWNRRGELLQTLDAHRDRVNAVAFSPDNRFLATASNDRTIKLWQSIPQKGFQLARTLNGHDSWVTDIDFLPTSNSTAFLVSAGYDNSIKFWDKAGQIVNILTSPTDSISRLSLHPSGQILATTTWDNQVKLWRLDDTLLNSLTAHGDRTTSVTWNRDGTALATASQDKTATIWNFDLPSLQASGCQWLADYFRYNHRYQQRRERPICESGLESPSEKKKSTTANLQYNR